MKLITYDFEVFAHDWLVVLKDKETGLYTCIWNDNEAFTATLSADNIYIGFNSKHYDQYIAKAVAAGLTPQQIKQVNDFIISGNQGWECPLIRDFFFTFNNVDIKDDMQVGLSLKAIEGHFGMSIQESTVSFDLNRPLTQAEREETEFYCKHDVDTTEKLTEIRRDYLKNKVHIGRLAGISDVKAMSMTNAKLTALMLKASKRPHDDERNYVYPDNLKREYIPPEVFAFFNRLYDRQISDEELFGKNKENLEISIGECPVTLGFGGIHGAIPNYLWEKNGTRTIKNEDVGSYYPHLCTINGYTSRNIPSPKIYEDVLETRMKAKAAGDKATANALKLICNTTFGCLFNKHNDLYDPLMGRSVCISGQLYLLELARHCWSEIDGLKIVQLNTDGIMVECDEADLPMLTEICKEWQERTGFELEEDTVAKIAQKDVNNYIEVQPDGKVKKKGGYLVKGIAPVGAFNVNNTCVIVAKAIEEYFVHGTPAEQTINSSTNIFDFQMIAKAGAKYKEAYHMVGDIREPVQKVNRVYATSDERYGKLYKVKAESGASAEIESLPEHCIIDNDNKSTIDDIDRTFYIELANKRINDFKGIKPEKTTRRKKSMATKKTQETAVASVNELNIYQRLALVREHFAATGVRKSGKNMQLTSKYFELDDIVPIAMPLFHEQQLIPLVNFTKDECVMTILDMLDPTQTITFTAPMREWLGNAAVTPVQALGATETYMRRYLYQQALDIVEADEMENRPNPAPKTPATPEQRQEVKKELTAPAENATELQIKGLKTVLKKLKDTQPDKEEMIAKMAVETQGFTQISKTDCENLINRITEMLEGA